MERTFSPFIRQFSSIEGLQAPYTLVYSLDEDSAAGGCRLTLCRTGSKPCIESLRLAAPPEHGYRLLQFLCENVVQPEVWRDVVEEIFPCAVPGGKGGITSEH